MGCMYNLLFTLIVGLFISVGSVIVFATGNNRRIINFSLSAAFGSICMLVLFELVPEAYESMTSSFSPFVSIVLILLFACLGMFLLKVLDNKVPEHSHKHCDSCNSAHYYHIGLVSSIALVLHNVIEGMAVYSSFVSNFYLGVMVGVGVSLHNIPMGMEISSMFYRFYNSKLKVFLISLLVSVSTFVGGLIVYFLGDLNEFVVGIFLCLTLGMLVYIVLFELLPHLLHVHDKKDFIFGVLFGVFLFLCSFFIEALLVH